MSKDMRDSPRPNLAFAANMFYPLQRDSILRITDVHSVSVLHWRFQAPADLRLKERGL